ncbi:G-protein alpha subunit [Plasmodiophora brassicae]|uniref:Uncharacterized protein n=1 Tax=Plasmodiophora brassicae TaxID=37360 RepID=A0A0G4J433_PLABS|nr:hypothetical protein PBRA_002528 [Plasmodiophora brassicae]SPQ93558.1 unnamed protein product [Plasmodiophora brassicae]
MSCCKSDRVAVLDEMSATSAAISKQLAIDKAATARLPVVLFLGVGESGKSTFFKQLRMCHGSPWTADELLTFKTAVDRMVINDIIRLAMATQNAAILEAFPEKLVFSPSVETVIYKVTQWMIEREIPNTLTEEVASYIYRLWTDETIRKVYSKRALFHMGDHAEYFFNKIATIASPSWMPNDNDLVNLRIRTAGIQDQKINIEGLMMRAVDVGGQRSERRKWISVFDNATAIMYVTAISDYDRTLQEDNKTSRLYESLEVFEELCATPALKRAGFVVFFNKTDLFTEKLKTTPFGNFVPQYSGDGSFESASKFLEDTYRETAKRVFTAIGLPKKQIHVHFTTAIDRQNILKVFSSVQKIILDLTLKDSGLAG